MLPSSTRRLTMNATPDSTVASESGSRTHTVRATRTATASAPASANSAPAVR